MASVLSDLDGIFVARRTLWRHGRAVLEVRALGADQGRLWCFAFQVLD